MARGEPADHSRSYGSSAIAAHNNDFPEARAPAHIGLRTSLRCCLGLCLKVWLTITIGPCNQPSRGPKGGLSGPFHG